LGSAAVALYSIPLKLTELQQIPLRSFVATAFPKMSKASLHNQIDEVKICLYLFWSTTYLL
jgi:O-antigen/teichoic acid export membrane protein